VVFFYNVYLPHGSLSEILALLLVEYNIPVALVLVLLAPHTSGPRDVSRCGALSLLEKTPHYRGDPEEIAAGLNA
jgi:hypothetical protein